MPASSGGNCRMRRGHKHGRWLASWLAVGTLTLSLVVLVGGARGDPPGPSAGLSPHAQFLGDAAGGVFTFTVTTPATGPGVGFVEIDRPSTLWTVVDCPRAPAGWTAQRDPAWCRYENPGATSGALPPATSSSDFQLTAASGVATTDQSGTFQVTVGEQTAPDDNDDNLTPATAAPPGALDVTAFSFQVLDVVVSSVPAAPGAPCPPASRTATAGAGKVLVVCGRNRTSQTLVPAPGFSSLGGTFLQGPGQGPGTFSSGPIPAGTANVVLGSWTGARTVASGQGKTLVASVGSSATQTSPPVTLTGYVAVAAPAPVPAPARPVANPQHVTTREGSPVAVVPTGSGGDGGLLTVAIATAPVHGTLSGFAANLAYTPAPDYVGEDSFTFTVSSGATTSAPATIGITVEPVNHAPSFVRGRDLAVVATAGPQRFVGWATRISAGPANESSQTLRFKVTGNTNQRLTSQAPAVSPSGDLTFTPNADSSGAAKITLVLVDNGGRSNGGVDTSPPQTFTISVARPVLPVVDAQAVTTDEDSPSTVVLTAHDPGSGVVSFSALAGPGHGSLGTIGPVSCAGQPRTCIAGVTYTPDAGYSGSDSFTYAVGDRQQTSAAAVVNIDVKPRPVPPAPRKGPTLSALSPAKDPSGPPGVGLELIGSGYGCQSVYFFFDGSRIGVAHPDKAGRVRVTGLEVPGDIGLGRHVVETSCRVSGKPVQVVTSFDVTRASLHRSVVMTSLPKPSDVDLKPKSLAASMFGSIVLILLVAVPGGLLDTTLDEHYLEIRGWFGFLPKPRATPRTSSPGLRLLGLIGFLAAGGVAGALLDPGFGLNRSTLALALGLCASLGVVFLGFQLPNVAYMRRRNREWGSIVLRPGALVLTAVLVGISRLLHLQPGFLFGVIGGLAFTGQLREKVEGRLAVVTALFVLLVAVVMWFLWVPVSIAATNPRAGLWLIAAEVALGGAFAAGLQSLVVGLLPLREMDGSTVKSWSMLGWSAVYLVGVFAYVLIILRPAAAAGADPHGQMWKALVAAGIFAAFAIAFWACFRFRSRQ